MAHTTVREESGCAGGGGILGRLRHNRIGMERTDGDPDRPEGDSAGGVFQGISGSYGREKVKSRGVACLKKPTAEGIRE